MDGCFNISEINSVLQAFYRITKARIALFDSNFHEYLAYPDRLSPFCKYIRTQETLNARCRECDNCSFAYCRRTGQPYRYRCHLGLTEIIVPIRRDQEIIGYLMCGQIPGEDFPYREPGTAERMLLERFGIRMEGPAPREETPMPAAMVDAVEKLLTVIAPQLSREPYVRREGLGAAVDRYILEHLQESLTAQSLAEAFGCGKTLFYRKTADLYGTGIMHHVTQLRIQKAKELLSGTDLPIGEIAARVGIGDYNYFSKVFKRVCSCTPSRFRSNRIL